MGMTWTEYWDGEPEMAIAFRKAHKLRNDQKNRDAWLQGLYIYEALCDASPLFRSLVKDAKALPYVSEPYPLNAKEQEEQKQRREEETDKKNQAAVTAWAKRANRIREEKMKKGEQIDGR